MPPLDFDLARFTSLQHLSISGIPLGPRAFASFGAHHPLRTLVLGPYTQPSASQLTPLLEGPTRPPSLQSIEIYPERWAYVGHPLTDDWEFLPSYEALLEFADRRSNAPGPRENGDASVYGVDASWRLPAWTPQMTFEGVFKLLYAAKAAHVRLGGSLAGSIVVEWSFRRQVAALRKQLAGEMMVSQRKGGLDWEQKAWIEYSRSVGQAVVSEQLGGWASFQAVLDRLDAGEWTDEEQEYYDEEYEEGWRSEEDSEDSEARGPAEEG